MPQEISAPQPKKQNGIGAKNWTLIWLLGMAGQLCWCLENNWFANYLYAQFPETVDTIAGAQIVTLMTIFSALATTFSTFFFGTWSDRIGSRKPFIAFGYIAWGFFTIVYGLTNLYAKFIAGNLVIIGIIIVATDTVMSFFGSAGNDSGFNAWCSDMLTDKNRGQMGMALASQPVLGTLIGTVLGGAIIGMEIFMEDGKSTGVGHMVFFAVMGALVMLMGIISLFTVKDVPHLKPNKQGTFWRQFINVFNFKEFFKRKELVFVNITVTVYFIGFNCYFVHIMNYLDFTLGFTPGDASLMLGIPLIVATLCTIPLIPLINKNKSPWVGLGAIICAVIGCLLIFFFVKDAAHLGIGENERVFDLQRDIVAVIGMLLIGLGYVASIQTYMVWQKKLYPEGQRGQFEGIRILFFVLFPMVAGPLVAQPIIDAVSGGNSSLPPNELFLAASIITVLAVIPLYFATKEHNKRIVEESAKKE